MSRRTPEPVDVVKARRDSALDKLVAAVPYVQFLGVHFDRRGDELTGVMPFREDLIGNPALPALHGGVTAAFLETTALIGLSWDLIWPEVEAGKPHRVAIPKTIGLTVDYLRTGLPRDAFARARVVRSGRRYASVNVEAWQDNRDRPIAQAVGHFVMPARPDAT